MRCSRASRRWLAGWGSTGPFFAYLHVLDLHGPYRPVPPFDEMFGRPTDMPRMTWEEWTDYKHRVFDGEHVPSEAEVAQLRAWYDGQLAWVDREVGRLLDHLRRTGVYDDSLIVVVADHGDGFMQHGFVSHSTTPFEELIHVPLIVKLPGSRNGGARVAAPAALVDLAPTLEHALGVAPRIAATGDGLSLAAVLEGARPRSGSGSTPSSAARRSFVASAGSTSASRAPCGSSTCWPTPGRRGRAGRASRARRPARRSGPPDDGAAQAAAGRARRAGRRGDPQAD